MSYSVNPMQFRSIFAVPTDIVDKHIRIANGDQLKVLLWILRNSPDAPDIAAMCAALKMDPADAQDYLQYWQNCGVLLTDGEEPNPTAAVSPAPVPTPAPVQPQKKPARIEAVAPPKPTSAEIAVRVDESPEIGHLFNEAQQKLGKTIGYDGQCTLLLLHDHYGLPAEVIFMLLDYCVSIGKVNYAYIEAIGRDWGNREIDTIIKAAEQIEALGTVNRLWRQFAAYAGIASSRPTAKQSEYLRRWSEEWHFTPDMILLAYDEMMDNISKLSLAYMDKVLMNWHKNGCRNPADVAAYAEQHKNSKTPQRVKKSTAPATEASYDLDKFNERSVHAPLKYERKNKQ